MKPREFARRLGIGPWLLKNFHRRFPRLSWWRQFGLAGGIKYATGELQMRRAAAKLPPISVNQSGGFSCTFMTGTGYWQQTLFCAHSLSHHLEGPLSIHILDDGSLTAAQIEVLQNVLLGVRIINQAEVAALLERNFPRTQFPVLRELRDRMPMLRKFFDLRAARRGWQLYLDSDMLFYRRPDFLIDCQHSRTPCHMVDRLFAYSLPAEQLERLTGFPVPACVNAGIVGLDDSNIDWTSVESWARDMAPEGRNPQVLEQTLTAMLLGTVDAHPAPADDYHILYSHDTATPARPVLLHYIYHAKLRYFARDWRLYRQLLHP